ALYIAMAFSRSARFWTLNRCGGIWASSSVRLSIWARKNSRRVCGVMAGLLGPSRYGSSPGARPETHRGESGSGPRLEDEIDDLSPNLGGQGVPGLDDERQIEIRGQGVGENERLMRRFPVAGTGVVAMWLRSTRLMRQGGGRFGGTKEALGGRPSRCDPPSP